MGVSEICKTLVKILPLVALAATAHVESSGSVRRHLGATRWNTGVRQDTQ